MDNYIERFNVERTEEWDKWMQKIPALKFSSDWDVKIIPPFGGALTSFYVKESGSGNIGWIGK